MTITSSFVAIAIAAATAGQAATPSQTPGQAPPLTLEIGLRLMRDHQPGNNATIGNGDRVAGYIWTDAGFCSLGAGGMDTATTERIRWRVAAHILERTGNAVVVEAEWQRVGTGGTPDGATSTRKFTIAPGMSAVLDEISPTSASPCSVTTARLEASVVLPEQRSGSLGAGGGARAGGYGAGGIGAGAGGGGGRGIGNAGSGSGGVGAGASGSGAGAASGFGGAGGVGSGARAGGGGSGGGGGAGGAGMSASAGGGGRGAAGPMSVAGLARMMGNTSSGVISGGGARVSLRPMPGASYDADVWLVHTPPGGAEETQKVTVHVTTEGQVLTFPQTVVTTERGPMNVDVAVMLSPRLTDSGTQVLQVVVARGVTGSSNSLGGSTKIIPLPSPADIVSFEMPQFDARNISMPIPDHQFSVRIRLTPGKLRFDW